MGRLYRKIEVGETIGDMHVYGETRDMKNNRRMLKCECVKCGIPRVIYEGNLRDRPNSSKHDIVCCRGIRKSIDPKFYDVWSHMKDRIYNKNNKNYDRYGGRGLTTDYDSFIDFYYDQYAKYLQLKIENLDMRISMDRVDNNLGYVKGNIRWTNPVTQARNSSIVREFYAISPMGTIYLTNNQTQFALRHGLECKHISDCLLGKQETTGGGWRFKEKDSLFINMYYEQNAIRELYT